jgi:hypothetical protein
LNFKIASFKARQLGALATRSYLLTQSPPLLAAPPHALRSTHTSTGTHVRTTAAMRMRRTLPAGGYEDPHIGITARPGSRSGWPQRTLSAANPDICCSSWWQAFGMDAVIWSFAILVYGGLVSVVLFMELRLFRDMSKSRPPTDAGSRRRILYSLMSLVAFGALEVAAWFIGSALAGPHLGGALVVAGLVVGIVVAFVTAVRVDQRAGRLG